MRFKADTNSIDQDLDLSRKSQRLRSRESDLNTGLQTFIEPASAVRNFSQAIKYENGDLSPLDFADLEELARAPSERGLSIAAFQLAILSAVVDAAKLRTVFNPRVIKQIKDTPCFATFLEKTAIEAPVQSGICPLTAAKTCVDFLDADEGSDPECLADHIFPSEGLRQVLSALSENDLVAQIDYEWGEGAARRMGQKMVQALKHRARLSHRNFNMHSPVMGRA